jgi:ABC-type antimicrobial peptide transport system permease subunit
MPVAVVNAAFAAKYVPGRDPIGQQLLRSENGPLVTIVGVVGNVRRAGKSQPVTPGVYYPAAQTSLYPVWLADFAVRSSHDPHTLLPSIQAAVLGIDRELPIGNVRTLSEVVGDSLALRRFQVGLIAVFAVLALVLTVVGVYGVAACAAAQRTVEFGVRAALGAAPSDILRLVLTQSAVLVAGGLALGLAGALAFARSMESLLFEVRPHDPATLVLVSMLLVAVALVASYVPARRAARIDPLEALRAE